MSPFLIEKVTANDFWKALYSGRYIARVGLLPDHTQFTFSPAVSYFPPDVFTWLGNLFFYGHYLISGFVGFQFFRLFIVLFSVLILHSILKYNVSPLVLLGLLAFTIGIDQKLLIRNSIFLVPFTVLLFWFWFHARFKDKTSFLYAIVVLLAVWANIHVTYLVGMSILFLAFIGDLIDYFWRDNITVEKSWLKRFALVCVIVLFAVVFVKPTPDPIIFNITIDTFELLVTGEPDFKIPDHYFEETGVKLLRDITHSFKAFMMSSIIERPVYSKAHQPGGLSFPLKHPGHEFNTVSWVILFTGLGSWLIGVERFRYSLFLPFVLAALLGLSFVRSVALIPLITVPVLFIRSRIGDFSDVSLGRITYVSAVVGVIGLAGIVYYKTWVNQISGTQSNILGFGRGYRFSDRAPEYVLENYPEQKFYNSYNSGGYLIWKWWPRKEIFIDSKSLVYDQSFLNYYSSTNTNKILDDNDFQYAIVEGLSSIPYSFFIPHPRWELKALDKSFLVFAKRKKAQDVNPDKKVLYSEEEMTQLSDFVRIRLRHTIDFVKLYQNRKKMVGALGSPFLRVTAKNDKTKLPNSLRQNDHVTPLEKR